MFGDLGATATAKPGKHGYLSFSLSLSLSFCLFVCFGRCFCGLVEKLCHPSQKGS